MVAGFIAPGVRADTIYIGSGGGNPVEYKAVKVLRASGGQIVYTLQGGNETRKPIEQVVRLQIDDEPALNAAENALAAEKWDDAVDGYTKTARATNKPWLKDWASMRLLAASAKSNRFDAAANAYVSMLLRDPETAAKYKPRIPEPGSTYIDSAIATTNTALANKQITDAQKMALLGFLLDLTKAKKDRAGEEKVSRQIEDLLAKDPANPAAGQAIARRKLTSAQKALDAKDFARAISEIESGKASFIDPQQQADALFCLAEAKFGAAQTKKEPNDLKDAALAYMRVVANFKDTQGQPHVADSLLKTAAIEEQLNEAEAATRLYQQIAQQYPDSPAAAAARKKIGK